jgi:mannose-6-phosphate isomerase-like protein (cupin superfamily)
LSFRLKRSGTEESFKFHTTNPKDTSTVVGMTGYKLINMKTLLITFTILLSGVITAQEVTNINEAKPKEDFDNVLVKKLDTDTNSTSFIIWIKKGVKSHKHETHSELINVIEGSGIMTLNKKSFNINAGDYFRIPQNTFHSLKVSSKEPMKVLSVQSPEFLGKDRVFENDTK